MKIKGLPTEADQDSVKVLRNDQLGKNNRAGVLSKDSGVAKQRDTTDRVNLDLGRSIQQILDPTQMAAARRAKVEELKKQVSEGTYQMPSSEKLARAIGEELTFEILANGPTFSSDSGDS